MKINLDKRKDFSRKLVKVIDKKVLKNSTNFGNFPRTYYHFFQIIVRI